MLPADMLDEVCEACGRPKYKDVDMQRWQREVHTYNNVEPPWARALCWSLRGTRCHCKPGLAPVSASP